LYHLMFLIVNNQLWEGYNTKSEWQVDLKWID
jgi:hypothetical protein